MDAKNFKAGQVWSDRSGDDVLITEVKDKEYSTWPIHGHHKDGDRSFTTQGIFNHDLCEGDGDLISLETDAPQSVADLADEVLGTDGLDNAYVRASVEAMGGEMLTDASAEFALNATALKLVKPLLSEHTSNSINSLLDESIRRQAVHDNERNALMYQVSVLDDAIAVERIIQSELRGILSGA